MPDETPSIANEIIAKLHALATRVGEALAAQKASQTTALQDALLALKNEILGGASSALDTLKEIEDILKSEGEVDAAIKALRVVNYDRTQELTSTQKETARGNIGAAADADVVKHVAQSLGDTAKAQARTNIGAAAAADLATLDGNAVKKVAQTLTDGEKTQARTNIDAASGTEFAALVAVLGDTTNIDFVATFNAAYEPAPAAGSGD